MEAYLVPHVPFMLPEFGGQEILQYIPEILKQFETIRIRLENNPPAAILICSPHYETGTSFRIGRALQYRGSFANLRRPDLVDTRKGAVEISKTIQRYAETLGFLAPDDEVVVAGIDYGTIVPLKLIDPGAKIPIVPISVSMGTKEEHFVWGKRLYDCVSEISDNIIFIASTELTQDIQQTPRAYPSNSKQDVSYLELLLHQQIDKISAFAPNYFEKVENNLLPTCILSGFGYKLHGGVLLYSGFIGCGCAFLEFT